MSNLSVLSTISIVIEKLGTTLLALVHLSLHPMLAQEMISDSTLLTLLNNILLQSPSPPILIQVFL